MSGTAILECTDEDKATPFFLACWYNANDRNISVITYLLSFDTTNSLVTNSKGQNPFAGTKARAGANAKALRNRFDQVKVSHPVGSYVNVYVLGESGAGKTTLCQVIRDRADNIIDGTVDKVEGPTAGIVPVRLKNSELGNITLHDFAGQPEFYASHAAILENMLESSGAVIVVLLNLKENLTKQMEVWWRVIVDECNKRNSSLQRIRILAIGSHADEVAQSDIGLKINTIQGFIASHQSEIACDACTGKKFVFAFDCRQRFAGPELQRFLTAMNECCTLIQNKQGPKISLFCNFLYSILDSADKHYWSMDDLLDQCKKEIINGVPLPGESREHIAPLLKSLHSSGLIVYLEQQPNLEQSAPIDEPEHNGTEWIIVHKEILLSELNGFLFTPTKNRLPEYKYIVSNTGIISSRVFREKFHKYPLSMLICFLKSMRLCESIKNSYLFTNLEPCLEEKEDVELFFFPSLLLLAKPEHIASEYRMGWCFICNEEQFFPNRFLHVLLLHVAFTYALPSVRSDRDNASCYRQCSIWINGIHWRDVSGKIHVLVELHENKRWVVVQLTCVPGAEREMDSLHCKLLEDITSLQEKHCNCRMQLGKYYISPSHLKNFPPRIHGHSDLAAQVPLYSMDEVHQQDDPEAIVIIDNEEQARVSELRPGLYKVIPNSLLMMLQTQIVYFI